MMVTFIWLHSCVRATPHMHHARTRCHITHVAKLIQHQTPNTRFNNPIMSHTYTQDVKITGVQGDYCAPSCASGSCPAAPSGVSACMDMHHTVTLDRLVARLEAKVGRARRVNLTRAW